MPVGTPLEITAGIAEEIEQMLANNRNVSVFSTRVGGSSGMDMSQLGKNTASIDVRLVPTANRSQDTDAVMAWARREAEKLLPRDATVSVQRQDQFSTMAGSSSLQVNVRGASLDRVQDLAAELRDRLAELPGLAEVTSSLDERLPEQQVIINRRKAAAVGLAPAQIALQVNAALTALRPGPDESAPGALSPEAGLAERQHEHAGLRQIADALREAAERIGPATDDRTRLDALEARLRGEMLPHQHEEERALYPEAARRLGGQDPMAPLVRMHAEMESLVERIGTLLRLGQDEAAWRAAVPELRRSLFALEALLRLHLTVEEEMMAAVSAEAPRHAA
jgi:hypothetical protein